MEADDSRVVLANRLELLERVADDLAHEIKNPLHSLVINLAVLKRRISRSGAEGTEEMLRYASVLDGELERVNRRIELLLTLFRSNRGVEPATLDGLVADLMELIELKANRGSVSVRYEPATEATPVRVPRNSVCQAILNLVLDALDDASPGDTLEIRTSREGDCARLVVERSWATPAAEFAKSSNDATAADTADSRLAIARALTESAGGHVQRIEYDDGAPESHAGGGLSLVLTLPLAHV